MLFLEFGTWFNNPKWSGPVARLHLEENKENVKSISETLSTLLKIENAGSEQAPQREALVVWR